jgi:hypothetical protein
LIVERILPENIFINDAEREVSTPTSLLSPARAHLNVLCEHNIKNILNLNVLYDNVLHIFVFKINSSLSCCIKFFSTLFDPKMKILRGLLTVSVEDGNKLLDDVYKLFVKRPSDKTEKFFFEDFIKNFYNYLRLMLRYENRHQLQQFRTDSRFNEENQRRRCIGGSSFLL